jgi:hypothetical protein
MITDQPIGRGVLYVSSNVRPEAHAAFTEWCDSIHHFDTMRIDGFLSLRRFELVDGITEPGAHEYRLLTLYQVNDPGDADFSTPAYQQHTATYAPPPDGVTDGIEFERHVLRRRGDPPNGATQPVGRACVSLVGVDGPWLADAVSVATGCDGALNAYVADGDAFAVLLVDVETAEQGAAVLSALSGVPHGGSRRSLQLFAQVFPNAGVLVRDRVVVAPRA